MAALQMLDTLALGRTWLLVPRASTRLRQLPLPSVLLVRQASTRPARLRHRTHAFRARTTLEALRHLMLKMTVLHMLDTLALEIAWLLVPQALIKH